MSALTDIVAHSQATIIVIQGDVGQIVINPSGATPEDIAAVTALDQSIDALAAQVHALVPTPPAT